MLCNERKRVSSLNYFFFIIFIVYKMATSAHPRNDSCGPHPSPIREKKNLKKIVDSSAGKLGKFDLFSPPEPSGH